MKNKKIILTLATGIIISLSACKKQEGPTHNPKCSNDTTHYNVVYANKNGK